MSFARFAVYAAAAIVGTYIGLELHQLTNRRRTTKQ